MTQQKRKRNRCDWVVTVPLIFGLMFALIGPVDAKETGRVNTFLLGHHEFNIVSDDSEILDYSQDIIRNINRVIQRKSRGEGEVYFFAGHNAVSRRRLSFDLRELIDGDISSAMRVTPLNSRNCNFNQTSIIGETKPIWWAVVELDQIDADDAKLCFLSLIVITLKVPNMPGGISHHEEYEQILLTRIKEM